MPASGHASPRQVDDALLDRQQPETPHSTTAYSSFSSPPALRSIAPRESVSRSSGGGGGSPEVQVFHDSLGGTHLDHALVGHSAEHRRSRISIGHMLDANEQEDFLHEEHACCGCSFACGRCLSHCWFLTACCGFVLLSSLPRILTLVDFIVTVLVYSISFAGQSSPSLSFWQFLKLDFDHYSFAKSGGSLVILSFLRAVTLFFVFAYRFHLRPAAFVCASFVAATSALFILIKFSLNENEHLHALLIWSFCITCAEFAVWLALRRHRIAKPQLQIVPPTLDEHSLKAMSRDEVVLDMDTSSSTTTVLPPHTSTPGRQIRLPQQTAYHRLDADDEKTVSAASSVSSSHALTMPLGSFSTSSSFASGVAAGSPSFPRSIATPPEVELDPQSLADPDSLFIEVDSLLVHYKLSINGRPVLAGGAAARGTTTASPQVGGRRYHRDTDSPTMPPEEEPLYPTSSLASDRAPFFPAAAAASSSSAAAAAAAAAASISHASPSSPSFASPIVLLHGFGSSVFQFRALWAELSARAPLVLAFDRPGFGLTSRPLRDSSGTFGTFVQRDERGARLALVEQENPYTQEYATKLLLRLMSRLGFSSHRSVLVAHSTGGAIAVRAAITRPDLFGGCFLISPHLYTAGFPAMLKSLLRTKLGKMITQQLVRSELGEVTMRRAWFDAHNLPPDALSDYQRALRVRGQMEALIEIAASMPAEGDPWSKLSTRFHELAGPNASAEMEAPRDSGAPRIATGTPVCIVHGIQDKLLDVSESVRAYKQMTSESVDVTLVKIDRCGHVPHEEFPALTLEHLVAFLSEIEFCQATTMDDEADQGD